MKCLTATFAIATKPVNVCLNRFIFERSNRVPHLSVRFQRLITQLHATHLFYELCERVLRRIRPLTRLSFQQAHHAHFVAKFGQQINSPRHDTNRVLVPNQDLLSSRPIPELAPITMAFFIFPLITLFIWIGVNIANADTVVGITPLIKNAFQV